MIILIILTIALFASWLLIPQKLSRYIIGSIVTFLFVVQIIGIVANMTHHFGMQKETIHESEKTYLFSCEFKITSTDAYSK